jgi:archaeosortase B (VPXXXP-CTERM-specific)
MEYFAFIGKITASILGYLLNIFGVNASVNENIVIMDTLVFNIIDECTAIYGFIMLTSCILAYPTNAKKKIIGIVFGIPSLYVINMVRLVALAFMGLSNPDIFEYIHTYLWQTIFIIFVIIIWLTWLDRVVN